MVEQNGHTVFVNDAEILSTTVGEFNGEVRVILTARLDLPQPDATNLSISLRQAWRMKENLNALFQNSEMLIRGLSSDMIAEEEGAREGYDRLVKQGQQRPPRRRKRKET